MTRVTNFGLKRTYLEAGFSNDDPPSKETALVPRGEGERSSTEIHNPTATSFEAPQAPPPKKKRKRTPKSKRNGNITNDVAENKDGVRENEFLKRDTEVESDPVEKSTADAAGKSAKRQKKKKNKRDKGKSFTE